MKRIIRIRYFLFSVTLICLTTLSHAQLVADAGRDTTVCTPFGTIRLGGNPAASGGTQPYSYKWTCRVFYRYMFYSERHLLTDSLSPNPSLSDPFHIIFNGTINFILKVTDANKLSVYDTVKITISMISFMTLRNLEAHIRPGDSVEIEPANLVGGIPPFIYKWEPVSGLSNPAIRNPFAKPLSTTFYICYVTDSVGCKNHEGYPVYVETSGINDERKEYKISIFPNPVTPESRISLMDHMQDNLVIQIFDLNGKLVISDNFTGYYMIGDKIYEKGLYIYHIIKGGYPVSSGKFLKI